MKEMIIRIWKKWFGQETAGQVMNPVCNEAETVTPKAEKPSAPSPMLERLETYLFDRYDFRFNVLTEQSEYAPKGDHTYQLVDQRTLNTLCIEARAAGINCWDKDVSRLLCSQKIADFHPFTYYIEHLPEWDGIDRVTGLARRVSDNPVWENGFHRWMLGMTAQWMKMESQCANAVAPLLVSTEQGRCKSTFCSRLLPEALQGFYIDKFDLTSVSGCEQKLSLFGLINMEEFARYSERSQATLKNLMQLRKLTFRKSHRSYYSQLPRIASFIGTSNQKELLTDSTGSRRFLCVEVKKKLDCTPPDYALLYAQLKTELLVGERFWFSAEEEKEIQENNRAFYKQSPAQEIFFRCFRLPKDEEAGRMMTATEIFCRLQKKFPSALRNSNASQMGKALQAIGVKSVHTRTGNSYCVVPV